MHRFKFITIRLVFIGVAKVYIHYNSLSLAANVTCNTYMADNGFEPLHQFYGLKRQNIELHILVDLLQGNELSCIDLWFLDSLGSIRWNSEANGV